jgi:hypothetical protein
MIREIMFSRLENAETNDKDLKKYWKILLSNQYRN